MEISLVALRRLAPTPNALAIALLLVEHVDAKGCITARTVDIAEEVGISRPTAQRAIAELITAGFMTRLVRGRYQLSMSELCQSVSEERSLVSEPEYVRTTSNSQEVKEVPNGTSGAEAPKGITLRTYDDGDDIGGVGRIESKSPPVPRKRATPVPSNHRSVPRSEWTMDFVYKEFTHRLWLWQRTTGKTLPGDQDKPLKSVLRKWALDYGLTPQEAAELCDRFFDDPKQTVLFGKGWIVYRQFLYYVKVNLMDVRGTVITEDFRDSLYQQEVPW